MTAAATARPRAVPIGGRTIAALVVASAFGALAFTWPLLAGGTWRNGASTIAPVMFGALLLLVLAVVLAQVSEGALGSKSLALLGVLSALGAALRPFGAGTAGVETIFFLLVVAGRALGPGFGFTLGCTTLFASALVTGGVGPWLPYQMFACAWIGLGAGLLPRASGRRELALLAAYGAASAFVYGLLLNLSFWPFTLGEQTRLSFVAGAPVLENLHRYVVYDLTTSLGWDTGRAITNALLIALAGRAVLGALGRAARRGSFESPPEFEPVTLPAPRPTTHPAAGAAPR